MIYKLRNITEEILKSQTALWSSEDGFLLLYASFNDTNVGEMVHPWFSSNTLLQSGQFIETTMREASEVDKFMFTSHSLSLSLTGGLTSMGSFPDSRNVRYPTPGTINPEVSVWLLDLHNLTDVKKYQLKEPISLEGQ